MRRRCLSWPALLVKLSPHTGHSRQSTGLRLRGLWFEASSEDDDDDAEEEEEADTGAGSAARSLVWNPFSSSTFFCKAWCPMMCFLRYACRLNLLPQNWQSYEPSSEPDSDSPGLGVSLSLISLASSETDLTPSGGILAISGLTPCAGGIAGAPVVRGLCQRRWEARLAGQLNILSHSGHRYSTLTIREHLCWAREKGSAYASLHSWHTNSPKGLFPPEDCALGFISTGPSLILRPSTGDVVTSSSKLSFLMALGFLEAGLGFRSVPSTAGLLVPTRLLGAGRLLVVPLRLLLLVPIFRSTGAYRRWSRPERDAGVGNDSAEMGEPRLKLRSKYPLSCSLLMGRVGLYRAWHTASGLPNCAGFSSLGTGASAAVKSGDAAPWAGLDATDIRGVGSAWIGKAAGVGGSWRSSSSDRVLYETCADFLFLFTRNPLGILASNSVKALRGGGRSLEYPGLLKIWQHQKLAGLYLPCISILLLLKCFRLQGIAPLFLCRNDAIVLAPLSQHPRPMGWNQDPSGFDCGRALSLGLVDFVGGCADSSADVLAVYYINVCAQPLPDRGTRRDPPLCTVW